MLHRNPPRVPKSFLYPALTAMAMFSATADASSIISCKQTTQVCTARLDHGAVGNEVLIQDDKGREAARGILQSRRGPYGTIKIVEVSQEISKGFPVRVDQEHRKSAAQWTAKFPDSLQ